ncbi:MAG: tail fiber domain-containing protein [Saprospiraceae bacterium]
MQKHSTLRMLALAAGLSLIVSTISAQAPQAIPYQAVARNAAGNLLQNQTVGVRFTIHDGTATGTVVYQETHNTATNQLGLFSLNIGSGTVVSGSFAGINWGISSKFAQVEIDPAGGMSFVDMGTVQMLSVPYALYAASSGSAVTENDPKVGSSSTNYLPKWNGTTLVDGQIFDDGTNVGIGTTSPSQKLDVSGTTKTTNFQMTDGATDGYVLQSDASGNATWVAPSSVFSDTDTDGQNLSLSGVTLSIDNGNSVDLSGLADNLGNHTATQNLQTNGNWLSNDGDNEGVFIKTDGKVGIATNDPATELHVKDGDTPTLRMEQNGGSFSPYIWDIGANEANFFVRDLTFGGDKLPFRIFPGNNSNRIAIKSNNVGIGTTSPASLLDVNGTTKTIGFQMPTGAGAGLVLQSDASGNATWVAPTGLSVTETDPQVSSSATNYVPKWNGTALTDGLLFDNGTNIGIGTTSPGALLDIQAATLARLNLQSNLFSSYLRLTSPGSGDNSRESAIEASSYVSGTAYKRWLFGKGSGNEIGGNAGSDFFLNRYDDNGNYLGQPLVIRRSTGFVSVGHADPQTQLDVSGTTKTTNFQMTNGATSGYVLQSDASGNASWVAATSLSVTENDPQVSSSTTNRVPRWTGSTLSDGTMFDNGTNVGIGTTSPASKLDVEGGLAVGSTYSGLFPAPTDGAIIQGTVGIGTSTPINKLDVEGNLAIGNNYSGTSSAPSNGAIIQGSVGIGTNSPANKLDVEGSLAIGINYSGTTAAPSNGAIIEGNVGIGTSSPSQKLDVSGTTKTTNFQMTNGAANGYVLQSDASGNASWVAPATLTTAAPAQIQDADADTKIQVEESSNENKIRFDLGGTERWVMQGARLESNNSGHSVFIGEGAGANDNLTDNQNVFLGYLTGAANTTGFNNVAIGTGALNANTTGNNNTMIGSFAGNSTTGSGNVFIGAGAGVNESGSDKLYITNTITTTPLIDGDFALSQLKINGNLVIDGSVSQNIGGYGYINKSGNTGTSSGTHDYSIYASDRIAGSEFNAHSDARIKHVRGRSDNAADLETLMQLKITDYTLIDTVAKGTKPYKKVIAQEVEQAYPQAVSTIPGVTVPDIYRLSKIEGGFVALENSNLKPGERVKLIFGEKQDIAEVTAVSEKGFQTKLTAENGQVFVFGREVSDFRTVDYEALSMLNISATQELVKTIARQNETISALKSEISSMKNDIQLIKAALQKGATTTEK